MEIIQNVIVIADLNGIMQIRNGVPVDVYVPWTKGFLILDVDLEMVMNLIEKNTII